jgi:hypothetical protein
MIDVVIPLNNRSTQKNVELRYCLRGIEQRLRGVGNIFIIGYKPDWVIKCIHIPAEDDPRNRFRDRNIMNKMVAACKDSRVSKDFLMVHDDHFLLGYYCADMFPYYHCGPLVPGQGQYGKTKQNTISLLNEWDFMETINNYDTHCPILFNKEKFMRSVALADWSKWYGYCMKTLYCVLNGIEGEYMDDIKIRMPLRHAKIMEQIKDRKWFSIGDRCCSEYGMKDVLQELYPDKSKNEV